MNLLHYLVLGLPHVLPYFVGMVLTLLLWRRWPRFAFFSFVGILLLLSFQFLVR
jgi:hypothetical protein